MHKTFKPSVTMADVEGGRYPRWQP